jgi:hypothetical protein
LRVKKWGAFILIISILALWSVRAPADVIYGVSDYQGGSFGLIRQDASGGFTVEKNVVVGFGGDAWGYTFTDQNGADKIAIREFQYSGANDIVSVYDFKNWKTPSSNTTAWGRNLHGVASDGAYLYLALQDTYLNGADISGKIGRVPLNNLNGAPDRSFSFDADSTGKPRKPQGVTLWGGKVYALTGGWDKSFNHMQGEITEFDSGLGKLRSAQVGKNPFGMAFYGGKAYVACQGGMLGNGLWGDVWEVDLASMTSRQVLDMSKISSVTFPSGAASISIAKDGTAFLLVGGYDPNDDWSYLPKLYVTTADKLSSGDIGMLAPALTKNPGAGWTVCYDEAMGILWVEAGIYIEARGKDGSVKKKFTPLDLGGEAYSVSLWGSGSANGSNGDNGSGGEGGGGCDAGWGTMALLSAAALAASRKRGR